MSNEITPIEWFKNDYLPGLSVEALNKIIDDWDRASTVNRIPDPDMVVVINLAIEWRRAQVAFEESEEAKEINKTVGCKAHGSREDDGETRVLWWLFDAPLSEEQILKQLAGHYAYAYGTTWTSDYDCTGKWFAGPARIYEESDSKVLVKQYWNLDC